MRVQNGTSVLNEKTFRDKKDCAWQLAVSDFVDAMNPMIVVRPAAAAMTFAIVRISIHSDVTVVASVVFVVLAVAAAGLAAAVMLSIFFVSECSASVIDWCDRFGTRHQRPAQLANQLSKIG